VNGRSHSGYYDGEEASLNRLKALHAAGRSFLRIAATLIAEGIKPRRGTRWRASALNKIPRRVAAGTACLSLSSYATSQPPSALMYRRCAIGPRRLLRVLQPSSY
jgi:hypothetical protein